MAKTKLEIEINASGNAAAEIGQVENALGSLGDNVARLASGAQMEALRQVGGAAVETFRAFGQVGAEWVNMAAEAELVGAQLDAQLQAMGDSAAMSRDELDGLANELSRVTMFEDEAVLAAEGVLLRFGQINKETFPDAIRLSADLAQTMGTDITSAAQTLGMALEDPIGAMGRLRRAGIMFTAEQETMIKNMVEAGNQAGAQSLMMDVLQSKIGGVAEAAGNTFAGKMTIAKTAADNMRESIGQGFIDAFGALPVPIQTAGFMLQSFGADIGTVAGPIMTLIGTLAQLKIAAGAGGIGAMLTSLSAGFTSAAASAWAMIPPLIAAAAPFALLAAAIGLLVVVIKTLGPAALETLDMIGQLAGALAGRIASDIKRAAEDVGRAITEGIGAGIQSGWSWLVGQVQALAQSLLTAAKNVLGIHSPSAAFAEQIGAPAAQGVAAGFDKAAPAVSSRIGGTLAGVPGQAAKMAGAGGGGASVTVIYSPTFSAASLREFETMLIPLIDRQLSLTSRRRV